MCIFNKYEWKKISYCENVETNWQFFEFDVPFFLVNRQFHSTN